MFTLASSATLALSLVSSSPASPPVVGQSEEAATVLFVKGERVHVRPGEVLEDAAVLIQDGRILAVGTDLVAPEGARELSGVVVCAGFIDPWSGFGLDTGSAGDQRTSPATLTTDGLDLYVHPGLRLEVLGSGVTCVRLNAGANSSEGGIGAVVRTHPGPGEEVVLLADSCVATSIGITRGGKGQDAFSALKEVDKLVGSIVDGRNYLRDKNEFKYELEDWQKDITEKEEELEKGFKKAKKDREKDEEEAEEKGKEYKPKKYKEDKQPSLPKFNADKEVMGRVANGELPLVVQVHRSAELRSLLEATARFKRLRLVIAGGTEALVVADELAERKIPVIVWPALLGETRLDELSEADLGLAGRLEEAGVRVLIGTGGGPIGSRDLSLLAALAVGHGLTREGAFEALTLGAAEILDIGDRVGSLESGKDADLLILDGEPLATTTRITHVISNGDLVVGE